MSKAKQVTAERRGPLPARAEGGSRQVVIRLDQKAFYGILAVLALLVALVAGVVVGRAVSSPGAPAASAPPQAQAANPQGLVVRTAQAPSIPGLDPNLDGFQAAMASETFQGGGRVGVGDIDNLSTFNFGDIPADQKAQHTFKLKNIGDQDLVIGQVYTSCGCTIPSLAGQTMDEEGKLSPPLTLKPGQEQDLSITYDPAVLGDEGEIKKYVQIFSNDPKGKEGETRFRLTGNVVK